MIYFFEKTISFIFIKFFSFFPKVYKIKILRKFFTNNYKTGLVAVGEKFTHRFRAIGPRWLFVDTSDCDVRLNFQAGDMLPFADNSQRIIYSTHMIEHLQPKALESFIKECFRILKPGGYLRFEAPCAKTLIEAYKGENLELAKYFSDDIKINLIPKFKLGKKYAEPHVGILGVLSCYVEEKRQIPVYVSEKIFREKINTLTLEDLETWLHDLQTSQQKSSNGHNNLIYYEKLERLSRSNGACKTWQVNYGKTHIPGLFLNCAHKRYSTGIIEGSHRTSYSVYFEAQKAY